MVGRPGGGVFVAYGVGYPTTKLIRVYNVVTGATLDVPGSSGAEAVSMSAEPDGRLWITWSKNDRVKAIHTNAAATRFGSIGNWGRTTRHRHPVEVDDRGNVGRCCARLHATTQSAINVWHTNIARTLTVKAAPRLRAAWLRRDVHRHRRR